MQNRFIRYLIFVAILITSDQIIGTAISYFAKMQVRDNRVGLLLENKINGQVYIVGSSRALNNYSPEVISKIVGKRVYNLGVSGSNIIFHEAMVDLILQSKTKPVLIIYNVDDYGALFKNDNIIFRKDVLYPYVDNSFINRKISAELNKPLIATFLCKTYRQNVNFISALKYLAYGREKPDYKTTNFDEYGSNLLVQRPNDPIPHFDKGYDISGSTQMAEYSAAFENIQMQCRANNVQLILSLPPLYKTKTQNFKEMILGHTFPGTTLLDFTDEMQDSTYFFNPDHMNRKGAILFSTKVAENIKKLEK